MYNQDQRGAMFDRIMYILEMHRFIIDPHSNKVHKDHKDVEYQDKVEKTVCIASSDTTYERLLLVGQHFLKDHYGYITIHQDENRLIRLSNHSKMLKDFNDLGVKIHHE